MTSRSASSTVSPARASAYARRPPTLIALYAGGRWVIVPVSPAAPRWTAAPVGGRAVGRRQLALEVVGRRRGPEADGRPVALRAKVVLDDASRVTQEDRQDARGERVERAAVTDPFRGGQPADERDDVVGGRSGRLGDHEDAVEPRTESTNEPSLSEPERDHVRLRQGRRGALVKRLPRPTHPPPGRARRHRTCRSARSRRHRRASFGR